MERSSTPFIFLFMMRKILLVSLVLLFAVSVTAQHVCVVVDQSTRLPVAYASIYGREAGKFCSVISNEQGRARVSFQSTSYTVSHLNYEKMVVSKLPDTLFLIPKYYQAGEVVVKSEPDWIRPLLRKFVKAKKHHYLSDPAHFKYQYTTQSIEGKNYYKYESTGMLRSPGPSYKFYQICPDTGTIVSVDTTMLTDVTNMRRMLYEDFVQEFDKEFIRNHKFSVGDDVDSDNPDEVELLFRSKKRQSDRGRFIIDTVRCVIRSASRMMGTDYNKNHRVSSVMLAFSRMLTGYNIQDWNVDYGVTYTQYNGCFYPENIRYKFYYMAEEKISDAQNNDFDRESGGGFSNMEAVMCLSPVQLSPTKLTLWSSLPRPWYIKINTDDERKQEISLAHLPAKFYVLPQK